MELLRRDPCLRLSGHDALAMIAGGETPLVPPARASTRDASFVGRDRELRLLHEAIDRVVNRVPANRCVHGASGIGKSALVRRFLRQLAADRDDVVVLSGRCYENESVPYKALDGVVDDLSRHLRTLPDDQVECVLPVHAAALTRAFPVLRQVRAICAASDPREPDDVTALGSRRQAFDALRELLARLAERCLLVVAIDDFHWADPDSVVLLEALLQEPQAPVMLTLLSFRREETEAKPFLQALLDRANHDAWSAIALDDLADEDAARLVRELLPVDAVLSADGRYSLMREAGGSPFLIEQLALYAGVAAANRGHAPTFARMLHARLAVLSGDARRFLETLAVCGRPMSPALICDASGVVSDRQSLITTLRASHFIRSSGSSDRVETYHDRIGDMLATGIEARDRQQIHARLVQALVARRSDDCESLFEHCRGAGDYEGAAAHAALAADKAAAVLAFDRAAVFYGEALTIAPASPKAAAWRAARADALAYAGRPADAAEAYLLAADIAGAAERSELQRRSAQQFLIGGHIDRGRDLIRGVLAGVGVRPARSLCGAVVSLLWRRAQLRWRGLRFVPRPARDIARHTLVRVDACWASATGLAMVDMIATSAYSARHLLMALDAGEPSRIARGLALEAAGRSATPGSRPWSRHLVERAKTLAQSSGHLQAIATATLADATIAIASGEWTKALAAADAAAPILRDRCVGVGWELSIGQSLGVLALLYLGELEEASRRILPLLAHARSRGNLYLTTELCTRSNLVWLAADNPDEGEQQARDCIARWSQTGFQRQHYSLLLARVQAALYRGRPEDAWRLVAEEEPRLRRSFLSSVQLIRIETLFMRGRSALMMAASSAVPEPWLPIARSAARRIAREHMPWSNPLALMLNAGVAHIERNRPLARRFLEDAAIEFERADMKLHAAAARRRLGQPQATTWMLAQHVANPAAMTRMLAPGFADE
jgi:hypothetical protein